VGCNKLVCDCGRSSRDYRLSSAIGEQSSLGANYSVDEDVDDDERDTQVLELSIESRLVSSDGNVL